MERNWYKQFKRESLGADFNVHKLSTVCPPMLQICQLSKDGKEEKIRRSCCFIYVDQTLITKKIESFYLQEVYEDTRNLNF
ncbi:hypothetical protein CW304_28385 [Bacillus sp. UFRGS-B20]|nr:hypothetical protein CW304_28385 [Bacillus sp. UFRGS-B20]